MKNTVKVLAIIALAAVFGLAFPACNPDPEGDGTSPHTHTYATTWKSNATQHWHECSCGDKTDVADHDWEWVVTTPATTTADGLETETCTTCGATNGTRPITKLEQPKNQSDEITITTSLGSFTATVKGEFTDTQWKNVPTTIATAFTNAATDMMAQIAIYNAFSLNDITIMVEKTTEYTTYKVVAGNKKTLYLNINGLNSLQSKAGDAADKLFSGTASIDGVTPPPCTTCLTTYGTTAHLGIDANGNVVACTCGGTNCSNCTEQTDEAYNVPIRKTANVSVKQMNDTVAIIKSAMGLEEFANKATFAVRITAIHIVPGNTVNVQNNILSVGSDDVYPPFEGSTEVEQYKFLTILFAIADIYEGI